MMITNTYSNQMIVCKYHEENVIINILREAIMKLHSHLFCYYVIAFHFFKNAGKHNLYM